jgi:dihydrofolate synthase/folylpolyglutamate synthase
VTHFADYTELTEYMDRLGLFHMDLTLDRMERFREAHPVFDVPVVHVVGTNGKGSTAAFLCGIARAHGWKVGMFTSPHFVTPRERVQVNRMPLSREVWVELGNEVLAADGGDELTYFEFQTCLAMLAFEREGVDLAIMEAGLGGRYDATNVFLPRLTLFTPIGMDHETILGPTLTDIARDKAGAIHGGSAVITGIQVAEAMIPLQDRAQLVAARLMYAVDMAAPQDGNLLGLAGIHQTANARLALAGWRWLAADTGIKSDPVLERFGLESAFLPGRMQRVALDGREIILDGAHNVPALEALGAALRAQDVRPGAVVFACLKDKNVEEMLPLVRSLTDGPIVVPALENERASDPGALAARLGERARTAGSMAEALDACADAHPPVLVCGSLYLLAEFYTLHPEFLTPKRP